jgi:hypothetical protein
MYIEKNKKNYRERNPIIKLKELFFINIFFF